MPDELKKDIGDGPLIDPLTDEKRNLGESPVERELPETAAFRTEDGVVAPDPDADPDEAVRDDSLDDGLDSNRER